MVVFSDILLLLGSVTLFLLGLTKLSGEIGGLCGGKVDKIVRYATKNRVGGALAGMFITSVLQSSVATNVIAITFVEKGVIDFVACAAVIMGTNIGTTVTAQIVSLSNVFDFTPAAVGGGVAFIGMLLSLFKNSKVKAAGGAAVGFGFLFIGLGLMTESAANFKKYLWFTNLFLVDSPIILLLNGIMVTAVLQSSSVVSGIIIVLSTIGLIPFRSAAFMILGANIGTCLPVIWASANMSDEARKAACFNLAFNIAGTILFFFPLYFGIYDILPFLNTADVGRNIANFHTFFNLIVCFLLLPVLKPFCRLVERVFDFKPSKNTAKPAKNRCERPPKTSKKLRRIRTQTITKTDKKISAENILLYGKNV